MTKRKRKSIIILLIVLLVYVPVFFISSNLIKEYSRFQTYNGFGYDTNNPLIEIIKIITGKETYEGMTAAEAAAEQARALSRLLDEGYEESLSQAVNLLTVTDVKSTSPLNSYYIYIDEYNYSLLTSDLPQSGFEEVDGYVKYNDGIMQEVKLRFRGDNTWHWYFTQKSWRIKTDKGQLINGARKINLVNPFEKSEMMDYLSYMLGSEMGVIAADAIPVRVFVNNHYMGVAIETAQTDEYFLRNHGLLPSEIYSGDLVWVDENDRNQGYVEYQLWQTDGISAWEKMAENNSIAPDDFSVLFRLVEFVEQNQGTEFSYDIEKYVDIDSYLSWRACMGILGSVHANNGHNQKLYFDPSNGKLQPLLWDTDGLSYVTYQRPICWGISDLDTVILKNPEYADKMYGIIYETINNDVTEQDMLQMTDDAYEMIKQDIYADLYKDYLVGVNFSRDYTNEDFDQSYIEMKEWISLRYDFINETFADSEIKYNYQKTGSGYGLLKVEIDGISGAEITSIDFGTEIDGDIKIYRDVNLNSRIDDGDIELNFEVRQNSAVLTDEKIYPVLLDLKYTDMGQNYGPGGDAAGSPEYIYIIKGDAAAAGMSAANTVTGESTACTAADELKFADSTMYTTHPWSIQRDETAEDVIFGAGEHIIAEDIIINKNSQLIINEGAVLKIAEGVNIIVFGELKIKGTDENPVIITAYDSAHPWGVLAMQGHYNKDAVHEINGAYISYGGVPAEYDGAMYTGMVSAYNTTLNITNSKISYNCVGDDALNVKQGYLFADGCAFVNAFSDAIDMDISEGVIQNSYFSQSGNDAIDIMTTTVKIQGNYIEKSGDKGISVGEKSNPIIYNNIIDSCNIGIEIKDLSEPEIANCAITNNGIGINLYHKNDKYESGGRGRAENCIVMANETSVDADKESFFTLDNCLLDKYADDGKNNITFNGCKIASAYSVFYHQVQAGEYSGIGLTEEIHAGDR